MILRLFACLLALTVMGLAAPSTNSSDAFQSKTTWKGHEKNNTKGTDRQWPASARVLKRDGNQVTFNFWSTGSQGRKGVQLEGTVENGKIRAKVIKLLPGADWHETMVGTYMTGTVRDNALTINRKGHRGGSMIAEMTLQPKDAPGD